MNNDDKYLNRLISVITNDLPDNVNPTRLKNKIKNEFGQPFFLKKGSSKSTISANGKKHILTLFKQEQNVYNAVVDLLNTHLKWLFIYCNDTFESKNPISRPIVKSPLDTKEQIRDCIKKYMNDNHDIGNECNNESLGIQDLVSYDDAENMSEKLQSVYMFMSLFRFTQSGKKYIDHKKNYCILLNEFINNLAILLKDNDNKILTRSSKFILFSPTIVQNKKNDLTSFKIIKSENLKKYGQFILEVIINENLFKLKESQ